MIRPPGEGAQSVSVTPTAPEQMANPPGLYTYMDMSPGEGATVTLPETAKHLQVNLDPGSDLAALTLQLPSDQASTIGQRAQIRCSRQVTLLTITVPNGVVDNGQIMMNPGDVISYYKFSKNTWSKD